MDFVAREIFYLFWFSLTLGTVVAVTDPAPINQAVLVGEKNVEIKCVSADKDGNLIKWSYKPVETGKETTIKDGDSIKDTNTFGGHADGKSYTLTIKIASKSTAGSYNCDDGGKYSVLLIVLEQTCDYFPRKTNTLPCGSTLQLSCKVSCIVESKFLNKNSPKLTWLRNHTTDGDLVVEESSTSKTTKTSTLNVTLQEDGKMPIYTCDIGINLDTGGTFSVVDPTNINQCQLFASGDNVPCGKTEDPSMTTVAVTEDPNTKHGPDDKVDKSEQDSSPRSAETNNLAIRVLGVAGVLLLAQML